ncbi:hypothetical protein [Hymenobacter negativus]|uniref:Uncharacterized protein n=1 Tax=Hymenobacter negativus TaxID=2795026 RepID=A0ABS3QK42_9BACT|nr:hypothetical protein [Hymenobacter negativus]MBO2011466.1 hypothetical protein [Hymenobacter negativus]
MKTIFNTCLAQGSSQPADASQHARPVLLSALALLASAFALPAQAQQPQPVQMTQPDASSLRLRFNNPTQRPALLTVLDITRSYTLLNESHREPAYGTLLKFNTLPSGRYVVALHIGANRYRYTVQVDAKAPGGTTIAVRETTTHRVESGLATAAL